MEKVLKYSVLRYIPSTVSGEAINLGILFSDGDGYIRDFYYLKNYARLKAFDDELDCNILKTMLSGIKKEIIENKQSKFDIEKFIKYYINDFVFDTPKVIFYELWDEVCDLLKKTYFRYDYNKIDRPDKNTDKQVLMRLLQSSGKNISSNKVINGLFDENITYDIVADDYYVKIFDFDGKDLKRSISTAKTWAWNSDHEAEKKVYIIYRFSDSDKKRNKDFDIIKRIFNDSNAIFISFDDYVRTISA